MSDNKKNSIQKNAIISDSVQYNQTKSNLTIFNAQYDSNTKCKPPTFQPEKTKPSNIILPNGKSKNNKE